MVINGRDITFRMNIRATKKIAGMCPNRDLTKIEILFDQEDLVRFLDNLTEIAIAMSMNSANETPLTASEIEELDISDLNLLTQELRANFRRDRGTNVEIQEVKKNEEDGSNPSNSD